jgi:hypothetical protein
VLLCAGLGADAARAGSVGGVLQAPSDAALAITVSQSYFQGRSVQGVVVATVDDPAVALVAAAFAGGAAGRVPLLLTGKGVTDALVRKEIARVTGGPSTAVKPTVWLAGAQLGGLDGYDVRDLGRNAGTVAAAALAAGPAAGTAERVLVFDAKDWRAGAVAAAFGAAYGIPLLPAGALPVTLATTPKPVAIVFGSASVAADRFREVRTVKGDSPAALSVAAVALFMAEFPAGAPVTVPVPVQPVAVDGYGSDAGPAVLAAVAAAALQANGARPPVLLVDGRPPADLVAGCAAGGKDAVALCALGKADGATTVLALTVAGRADGQPLGGRLPGTGGLAFPAGAALVALGALVVKRSVMQVHA